MTSDERDELDNILDTALSTYSGEEPQAGLESRVLNRIRAEAGTRRFVWQRWAIPAFGCLLLWAVMLWIKRDWTPNASKTARNVVTAVPATNGRSDAVPNTLKTTPEHPRLAERRREYKSVNRSGAKREPVPKREEFPTPVPLSDEERAWIAFVARSPKQAQEVLMDAEKRDTEPIRIEKIYIQPLQSGG